MVVGKIYTEVLAVGVRVDSKNSEISSNSHKHAWHCMCLAIQYVDRIIIATLSVAVSIHLI